MNDRLVGVFNQFAFSARMFFTGALCNNIEFDENMGGGFLHLVRKGSLKIYSSHHPIVSIEEPSLIFTLAQLNTNLFLMEMLNSLVQSLI